MKKKSKSVNYFTSYRSKCFNIFLCLQYRACSYACLVVSKHQAKVVYYLSNAVLEGSKCSLLLYEFVRFVYEMEVAGPLEFLECMSRTCFA